MGSDFTVKWVKTNSGKFQSTLPYGERRRLVPNGKVVKVCQSTLPCGERPLEGQRRNGTVRFQSTLPYGERPGCPQTLPCKTSVSIHAPVWGATSGFHPPLRPAVFQSTLPYGERRWTFIIILSLRGFQSTLPYGERPSGQVYRKEGFMFQSTLPYGERQQSRTIFLPFSVIVYAIITILLY